MDHKSKCTIQSNETSKRKHWGKNFVARISKEFSAITQMINWTSPKFKCFALQKTLLRKFKEMLHIGRKILVNHITDKKIISRTNKELSKLNSKKTTQ